MGTVHLAGQSKTKAAITLRIQPQINEDYCDIILVATGLDREYVFQ